MSSLDRRCFLVCYRVFTRSSKRPALARVFCIRWLEVSWMFAGSCKHPHYRCVCLQAETCTLSVWVVSPSGPHDAGEGSRRPWTISASGILQRSPSPWRWFTMTQPSPWWWRVVSPSLGWC